MKHLCKRIGRIALIVVAALLSLVILILGGLNIAKYAIYVDYYRIKDDLCRNPGLNDGFVCQGICADDESDRLLISGHMGGVALHGDTVYVANSRHLFLLSLQDLTNATNGDELDIGEGVPVNNAASFVYADDSYVYVGEFHDGNKYVTDHPYDTPDGTQYAIVSRYTHDNLTQPDRVYSIRNKVQGICFTPDGQVILSTSYGLADSYYYVYKESDAVLSEQVLGGAPVYYLVNCQQQLKGPAMAEGLDWYDGKLITLTESASDKYIFGKFFFAYNVVALDLQSLT